MVTIGYVSRITRNSGLITFKSIETMIKWISTDSPKSQSESRSIAFSVGEIAEDKSIEIPATLYLEIKRLDKSLRLLFELSVIRMSQIFEQWKGTRYDFRFKHTDYPDVILSLIPQQKSVRLEFRIDWFPVFKDPKSLLPDFSTVQSTKPGRWAMGKVINEENLNEIAVLIESTILGKPCEQRSKIKTPIESVSKYLDLETLDEQLAQRAEIGKIGEQIAFKFEVARLKKLGVIDPERFIHYIAPLNTTAGYDILTDAPSGKRYIEVKSSVNVATPFFITPNEIEVLQKRGKSAWIYFVQITSLPDGLGEVCRTIQDPISKFQLERLKPVLFKYEGVLVDTDHA